MEEQNNIAPVNEELNVVEYKLENIKSMIYTIRGKQVMLDSDVAMLYHYETKYINLAVRRNKERFPENFCFQLTESEIENLRLQIATSSFSSYLLKPSLHSCYCYYSYYILCTTSTR